MSEIAELRADTLDAIAVCQQQRSTDLASSRLWHATLLTAHTLQHWWLPLLDDLVEDEA